MEENTVIEKIKFKNKIVGFNKSEVIEYISNLEKENDYIKDKMSKRIKDLSNIINKLISERSAILERLSSANRAIGRNIELMVKMEEEYSILTGEANNLIMQLHNEREKNKQSKNELIFKKIL